EEPDQQVEEADEREEEIGPVESEARTRERELPHLAAGENEQAVGEWLAGEAPLRLRKRSGGVTIRGEGPGAPPQARPHRRAGRRDGRDGERTLGTLVADPGPGEAVDLSRERQEAQPDRHDGQGQNETAGNPLDRPRHERGFSNPNATDLIVA